MSRKINLYAFCSIKGGVGKSTLAVATAKLIAAQEGRVPLVIDADLTGTSLADGLLLKAPVVPVRPDGALDLDATPTGKFHTLEETWRLRSARKNARSQDRAPPPAYLNDALNYQYQGAGAGQECQVEGMLWTHERQDRVLYLPSSPLKQDAALSLGWLYGQDPFRWICRLSWILDALIERLPSLSDVVVDLPPGVWEGGFTHELLVLASMLSRREPLPQGYPAWDGSKIQWQVMPILVTTPDWNDLLPALEYTAAHSALLPTLRPLVNRTGSESSADLRARLRRRLDPALVNLGVEEQLMQVDELGRSLGQVFRTGDLPLNDEVRGLTRPLGLEETS
jgi:hypothetical protein